MINPAIAREPHYEARRKRNGAKLNKDEGHCEYDGGDRHHAAGGGREERLCGSDVSSSRREDARSVIVVDLIYVKHQEGWRIILEVGRWSAEAGITAERHPIYGTPNGEAPDADTVRRVVA